MPRRCSPPTAASRVESRGVCRRKPVFQQTAVQLTFTDIVVFCVLSMLLIGFAVQNLEGHEMTHDKQNSRCYKKWQLRASAIMATHLVGRHSSFRMLLSKLRVRRQSDTFRRDFSDHVRSLILLCDASHQDRSARLTSRQRIRPFQIRRSNLDLLVAEGR